jgi:hypothetical protein
MSQNLLEDLLRLPGLRFLKKAEVLRYCGYLIEIERLGWGAN